MKIAPSILSADFAHLARDVEKLKKPVLIYCMLMLWTVILYQI
ncbi:hypothetical protein Lpp27_00795 [Lacticaseibacillus paracasei subsp. paracasei CNCM I-4648]|nr:hypothetical protein Lpp27_00795 [Lacticaseibacillus paracasei subsp. paracasei CNCM I-4648]